jgi:TRAP-type C4-dicarboxylate transport system permease small subunit
MSCLTGIVGSIINIVFSLLGIALFILLIWGGWEWMTSGGENKGVESAKTRIYNAVMGIVITAIAYALAKFVLSLLPRLMGDFIEKDLFSLCHSHESGNPAVSLYVHKDILRLYFS